MKQIAVIVGTRPEAIKMAPVIQALSNSKSLKPLVVSTSQHQQMVRQVFKSFGIRIDYDLRVMRPGQSLWTLSSRLAARLGCFFEQHPMHAALVQGDTSSAFFGGLCAFYHKIPVGHVEAGLRTGNPYAPFPEEMNRKLIGALATWHFAPTKEAVKQLRAEGVPASRIHLTGNTVVDALRWIIADRKYSSASSTQRMVLVTCHRRENFGLPMQAIAQALATIAEKYPEVKILFPLHPNPAVREIIRPLLEGLPNVDLCEPMDYERFTESLNDAWLVLSDSGGVQEEATALGKPVLVLRKETERPEGVKAGALKLVGANTDRIVEEFRRLFANPRAYARMARGSNVFGDGKAASRIVKLLEKQLTHGAVNH